MHDARNAGFRVSLVYVGVDDLSLSVGRVRLRVASGGHDVPLIDLERRFDRSFAHLREAIDLAQRVILIDNSGKRRRFLYSAEDSRIKYTATDIPPWAAAALA